MAEISTSHLPESSASPLAMASKFVSTITGLSASLRATALTWAMSKPTGLPPRLDSNGAYGMSVHTVRNPLLIRTGAAEGEPCSALAEQPARAATSASPGRSINLLMESVHLHREGGAEALQGVLRHPEQGVLGRVAVPGVDADHRHLGPDGQGG